MELRQPTSLINKWLIAPIVVRAKGSKASDRWFAGGSYR